MKQPGGLVLIGVGSQLVGWHLVVTQGPHALHGGMLSVVASSVVSFALLIAGADFYGKRRWAAAPFTVGAIAYLVA